MTITSVPTGIIEARELPYLSHVPADGRSIVAMPFYDTDTGRFYGCVPQASGKISVLPLIDLVEGTYLAKSPVDKDIDYRLPFFETMIQRFSFLDLYRVLKDVERDLMNGLASLHKYFVLLLYANEFEDQTYHLMVTTEVEYAFANHRAFYDRLHHMICTVHEIYRPKASKLSKKSFETAVNKSEEELRDKFLLPQPIIEFYKTRMATFLPLREIRNNIYHHGHSPDFTLLFTDGFAVKVDDRFAKRLGDLSLWPDRLLKPNRLASVLAILEYLVRDMFDATNTLGDSLISSFRHLPQPIASGYRLFLRSSLSKHLTLLDRYRQEHWFDPREILGIITPTDKEKEMISLQTRTKGAQFSYERTPDGRIRLEYGKKGQITIATEDYERLIETFRGRTVPLGTSRDNPPHGSVGEWLQENAKRTAIASYIGPILVYEGHAVWVDNARRLTVRFLE